MAANLIVELLLKDDPEYGPAWAVLYLQTRARMKAAEARRDADAVMAV